MRVLYSYLAPLLFLLAMPQAVAAQPLIVPAPQEMHWTSAVDTWLPVEAMQGVSLPEPFAPDSAALDRLRDILVMALPVSDQGNVRLVFTSLGENIPERTRHEAYRLEVNTDGINLEAESAHGLHNGLTTLAALVEPGRGIPCVSIVDWPDQEMRGAYVAGIEQAEERFEQFVDLKLNLLLLEDGRLYDLDNPQTYARFQRLADQCRANFIAFVPELQSLGWGHFVLEREPRAVEARWVRRAPFPVRDGQVYAPDPPLPEPPSLQNASYASGLEGWKAETHYRRWNDATADEAQVIALTDDAQVLQLSLASQGTVRVSQDVAVQPNARYAMRCRVRTQDVAGDGGAYIEVYGVDKNGSLAMIGQHTRRVQGTTEWLESRVNFDTGPYQRARPGGALVDDSTAAQREGYERVRVFLRLQDAIGTAWFDQVVVEPLQSPNPLANVVVTERAKVIVECADGKTVFEEGRDYALHVPELRYPYQLGDPLEISLAAGSRIHEGDTLLLSFNQANEEDITCCPSEPLYDTFMGRSIANVVEKLKPAYLHIGHDEPRFFNRDQRCKDRELSNEALFVDAIKRIHAHARAADPDVRLMIWDDAINPYQNGPHLNTSDAARNLPRDIIINVWWYDNFALDTQLNKSVAYFMDLGFKVTGSPWFRLPNAWHWVTLFDEYKANPKALGIIYTSWGEVSEPWAALEFTAEHAWSFGKPTAADL